MRKYPGGGGKGVAAIYGLYRYVFLGIVLKQFTLE